MLKPFFSQWPGKYVTTLTGPDQASDDWERAGGGEGRGNVCDYLHGPVQASGDWEHDWEPRGRPGGAVIEVKFTYS